MDERSGSSGGGGGGSSSRALGVYPEPYVVAPLQQPHKHTFIILHGRGSNGQLFGTALLEHPVPVHSTLAQAFPHAKFVFPTAAFRRAVVYKRKPITQWFDNWYLTEGREERREELQYEGLKGSCEFLHSLMVQEAAAVAGGLDNVVVGGLSQGCATMLVAMILCSWQRHGDEQPAAWFGMCGWLPLRKQMSELLFLLKSEEPGEVGVGEDVAFEEEDHHYPSVYEDEENGGKGHEKSRDPDQDPRQLVSAWLREELEFQMPPPESMTPPLQQQQQQQQSTGTCKTAATKNSPLFLGIGLLDDKVPITLSRDAKSLLDQIHVDMVYREYEGLGHWYSNDMLRDLVGFVQNELSSS